MERLPFDAVKKSGGKQTFCLNFIKKTVNFSGIRDYINRNPRDGCKSSFKHFWFLNGASRKQKSMKALLIGDDKIYPF